MSNKNPKLKKRVSVNDMEHAQNIVDTFGYWSQQYRAFVDGFTYEARNRIHNGVNR